MEKTKTKNTKPKYGMAQNVGFMFGCAWRMWKPLIVELLVIILVTAGQSIAELLIAPVILGKLESGAPKVPAIQKQTSDQVSLMDLQADAIREKLAAIQVETLTPIEAMNVLYQLKQLL